MSIHMQREVAREATGPTPAEFASEGASFLVGIVTPAYPDRLTRYYKVTPDDQWYYPQDYIDDLGYRIGAMEGESGALTLVGALFGQKKTVEQVQARQSARVLRKENKAAQRTANAARALMRFLVSERIVVPNQNLESWVSPDMGHGIMFEAADNSTVTRAVNEARKLAKKENIYFALSKGQAPNQHLVAFVIDPRFRPLDMDAAISIVDAATDPAVEVKVDVVKPEPGVVNVSPGVDPAEATPAEAASVGSIFGKIFGPKKAEGIEKKITKLEGQLAYWKGKLEEAKAKDAGDSAAAGFVTIGHVGPSVGNYDIGHTRYRRPVLAPIANALSPFGPARKRFYGMGADFRSDGMTVIGNVNEGPGRYNDDQGISMFNAADAEGEGRYDYGSEVGVAYGRMDRGLSMWNRADREAGPRYDYGDETPGMFSRATPDGRYYDGDGIELFNAADAEAGDRYNDRNFRASYFDREARDVTDYDYGAEVEGLSAVVGALSDEGYESRSDLERAGEQILGDMYARGEINAQGYRKAMARIPSMPTPLLAELVAADAIEADEGADEVGFSVARPPTGTTLASPAAASAGRSRTYRGRRRRLGRKLRRGIRKGLRRRAVRRAIKRTRRARASAAAPAPQPQVIVIKQGGESTDDGGAEYEDEEEGGEEESEGLVQSGAFAYGGPGYGDAALRYRRVVDLPMSPNGFVTTYPVS